MTMFFNMLNRQDQKATDEMALTIHLRQALSAAHGARS